jgi:hypothetical protein
MVRRFVRENKLFVVFTVLSALAVLAGLGFTRGYPEAPDFRIPPVYAGLSAMGVLLFRYGFHLLARKRAMDAIPRSKVRSLAMGRTELHGAAHPKQDLRAPITFTPCVYYRFLIEEERDGSRGGKYWATVKEGESTHYFYLQDETGRVLVDPLDAEVVTGVDYRFVDTVGGHRRRYTEWYILPGESVYVLGNARHFDDVSRDRAARLADKLAGWKRDAAKMKSFDTDGDGHVDMTEWDQAVRRAEEELLREDAARALPPEDRVAVGRGGPDEPFLISDHSETELGTKLAWGSVLSLGGGAILSIDMFGRLLKCAGLFR